MSLANTGTEERKASRFIPAGQPSASPLPIWRSDMPHLSAGTEPNLSAGIEGISS